MDVHQSDDEQVEAVKKWWKDNGRSTITGILFGLAAVGGWQAWQSYRLEQASQASSAYQFVVNRISEQQVDDARNGADQLMQDHADSAYASLAALLTGRELAEKGDEQAANEYLGWAESHAASRELKQLVTLTRARALLQAGKMDEALALLQGADAGALQGLYSDLAGDIQLAKGQPDEARKSYVVALATVSQPTLRRLLEMKLNDLGGPGVEMDAL